MMISDKFKFVYVAIPKTGTAAVNQWCSRHFKATQRISYHSYVVPNECKSYCIFITVRNPYERCWSWYHFQHGRNEFPGTFEDFLFMLKYWRDFKKEGDQFPDAFITQKEYRRKSKANYIIKLEELDMESLPFVATMKQCIVPVVRVTPNKPPINLTEKQKALVFDYCGEDFLEFGYKI